MVLQTNTMTLGKSVIKLSPQASGRFVKVPRALARGREGGGGSYKISSWRKASPANPCTCINLVEFTIYVIFPPTAIRQHHTWFKINYICRISLRILLESENSWKIVVFVYNKNAFITFYKKHWSGKTGIGIGFEGLATPAGSARILKRFHPTNGCRWDWRRRCIKRW